MWACQKFQEHISASSTVGASFAMRCHLPRVLVDPAKSHSLEMKAFR
jgi:hypothetical protein